VLWESGERGIVWKRQVDGFCERSNGTENDVDEVGHREGLVEAERVATEA
jgi:hypothetical protein